MKDGVVVGKRWRIRRAVASGGMGIVYAADDLEEPRQVAVKVLRAEVRDLGGAVDRFFREVCLASQLRSRHAVRIHGSGLHDGLPFMVMDLLEGTDLSRLAKMRERVAESDAVEWIADACDAVGEAHQAGIVHRDLKLANLYLAVPPAAGAPILKVLDFGLAKNLLGDEPSLTAPDDGFGTPQFMPPEQYIDVREVDARSDVWSLAVCLYRLVAGVHPVRGRTMAQLCMELGRAEFVAPPIRKVAPWASAELELVLARALARAKYDRYPDASELGGALRALSGGEISRRLPRRELSPGSVTRVLTRA